MSEITSQNQENERLEQEKTTNSSSLRLLKNKDFSALFLGGFISYMGSWFTMVAIIFFAIEITQNLSQNESTQAVALLTTFSLAPMLLLGPIGGVIADKYNRKKILIISDIVGTIATLALLFSSKMWHLYTFMIINSSIRQFFYPSRNASIPLIVQKHQLLSANGFIQTTNQLSRMLGPLCAGFIIAAFGLKIAFIVDSVSFAISALLLLTISTNLKPEKSKQKISFKNIILDMKEGAKITFGDKIIGFVVIVFGITLFAIGVIDPVAVPYLNFEFGLGEEAFGLIMAFSAVSGIIAAVILSLKGKLQNKLRFMAIAILALGFSVALISISPLLPGSVFWLFAAMSLIGFTNVGFSIPFSTLLQATVVNKHLGKVSGIIDTVMTTSSLIASGFAAIMVGFVSISLILGIASLMILIAGIVALLVIKLQGLDDVARQKEQEIQTDSEIGEFKHLESNIDKAIIEQTQASPAVD